MNIREIIEQAHMAGQRNAGIDPGYSAARAYCDKIIPEDPMDKIQMPEEQARGMLINVIVESNSVDSRERRNLSQQEIYESVEELKQAGYITRHN